MDLNSILAAGSIGAIIAKALPILLIINAVLSGVSTALNALKKAAVLKDGAFFTSFAKVIGFVQGIVDFLSANKQH